MRECSMLNMQYSMLKEQGARRKDCYHFTPLLFLLALVLRLLQQLKGEDTSCYRLFTSTRVVGGLVTWP